MASSELSSSLMPGLEDSISVFELNQRLSNAIAMSPGVRNVWVVGETSDVRTSSGHCYFELVEKADDGSNRSRIRANIWATAFRELNRRFQAATGTAFASGIKIRACVSASYHPTYGMSVTVSNIDPAYTVGDAMQRRAMILERLTREGILELNRRVAWNIVPNRIAVISAQGAAGYGDFVTHLLSNPGRLRFSVDLFPAVMQGDRTVPSVLKAMADVVAAAERYDALVIIRGGGSTSDLAAFDNYDLGAAIARCPLPVIVGIGHERDTTIPDFVASVRVKTPTAAAEVLIERVARVLDALGRAAEKVYREAAQRIADQRELLAHASASLPGAVTQSLIRRAATLDRLALSVSTAASRTLEKSHDRLTRADDLLRVLSPDAVLARGFSLTTLPDGRVLRDADNVAEGTVLTTRLAKGSIRSRSLK